MLLYLLFLICFYFTGTCFFPHFLIVLNLCVWALCKCFSLSYIVDVLVVLLLVLTYHVTNKKKGHGTVSVSLGHSLGKFVHKRILFIVFYFNCLRFVIENMCEQYIFIYTSNEIQSITSNIILTLHCENFFQRFFISSMMIFRNFIFLKLHTLEDSFSISFLHYFVLHLLLVSISFVDSCFYIRMYFHP